MGWEAGAKEMAFEALLARVRRGDRRRPGRGALRPRPSQALRAGKHVLVEKPIAATLAQADELGALAQDRGLVLQVGHLERFSAAYQAMAGKIGRRRCISRRPGSRRSSRAAPMSR